MKSILITLIYFTLLGVAYTEEIKMPKVPESIEAEIKKAAREKWPENYEMQLFHYENNIRAWQTIQLLKTNLIKKSEDETEKAINKDMATIFQKAEEKWPGNYEMQLFQIKNQIEAYMKMQGVE